MRQNKENISSEYQEAQEKFYKANVVGNLSTEEKLAVKLVKKVWEFPLFEDNEVMQVQLLSSKYSYALQFNAEQEAVYDDFYNWYLANRDKILSLKAIGQYCSVDKEILNTEVIADMTFTHESFNKGMIVDSFSCSFSSTFVASQKQLITEEDIDFDSSASKVLIGTLQQIDEDDSITTLKGFCTDFQFDINKDEITLLVKIVAIYYESEEE